MRIIVDANRVMSALLKDGRTRRHFLESDSELYAPGFLREELERHRVMLVTRSGLDEHAFDVLLTTILSRVRWVPDEWITPHLSRAKDAIGARDIADVAYLAAALAVGADAIWSEDLDFDEQALIPRVRSPSRPPP